jgi:Amt family ammonium transporter
MIKWVAFGTILLCLTLLAAVEPAFQSSATGLNSGDVAWMVTGSGLVLLMTPGLALFYGGMVSRRNIISTMLQSFVCLGVVTISWIVVGFSLAFGESIRGIIGVPWAFPALAGVGAAPDAAFAATIPFALFCLFQLKFAVITPALITGALAERVRFSSYLLFVVLFSVLIYPPLAHWTWHPSGFLRTWGVLDFAGGTVVHTAAGFSALAGAIFLGKRRSALRGDPHEPANIPSILTGTGMLWFGWFGFNGGSALAANGIAVQAFMTTQCASAAALLTWMLLEVLRGGKPTATGACIGAVVGLVGITPAAGYVSVLASVVIGSASALASHLCVVWRVKSGLDDTLDVFPCHGVGGIVGMLLTAVFAQDQGLIYGHAELLEKHIVALVLVSAYSFFGSWLLYWVVNRVIPFRVSSDEEHAGLDKSQHGESL